MTWESPGPEAVSGLGGSHPVRGQTCSLSLLQHYKWLPFEPGCGVHTLHVPWAPCVKTGHRPAFPWKEGWVPITSPALQWSPPHHNHACTCGQPPSRTADRCTLHFLCAFRFRTWGSFLNLAAPSPGPGPTCPRAQSSLAGSCLSGVGSQALAPLLISVCLAQPSLGNLCSPPQRTSFVLE